MVSGMAHEAVLLFHNKGIDRQMLITEFESVLDGLAPEAELAGQELEAAYLAIDGKLNIVGIVFFKLSFDSEGFADKKWNLPLASLVKKGVDGPDLGSGPVKIYMQSCNESKNYMPYLWDPGERGGSNDLVHLRNAIRENSLCLSREEGESEWMGNSDRVMGEKAPNVSQSSSRAVANAASDFDDGDVPVATSTLMDSDNDEFSQAIKIIESQRIRITALENAVKKAGSAGPDLSAELKAEQEKSAALAEELKTLKKKCVEQEKSLKETVTREKDLQQKIKQSEKAQKASEEKSVKAMESLKKKHGSTLKEMEAKLQQEFKVELETQEQDLTRKFKSELEQEKEKQNKQEQQLDSFKKELTALRGDKFRLMKGGAEAFFKKVDDADVSFMAFRPGVGHLTIPLNDIGKYIEAPNEYCAQQCNMSLEEYETWLAHYNSPICQAPMPGDTVCGEKIARTDAPQKYQKGFSDRCSKHGGK